MKSALTTRLTYLTALALVALLVACQSSGASQVEDAGGQGQEPLPGQIQSVEVAYQIQQQFPLTIQVTSTSIKHTGYLQKDFTCEGGNLSPQLTWTSVPPEFYPFFGGTSPLQVLLTDFGQYTPNVAESVSWLAQDVRSYPCPKIMSRTPTSFRAKIDGPNWAAFVRQHAKSCPHQPSGFPGQAHP